MAELVKHGFDWPPSAPEFRKLCTGENDVSWEHRNQSQSVREALGYDHRRLPDLTAKERRRETAKREIANMKSLFGSQS
jgi:hypothetical protein